MEFSRLEWVPYAADADQRRRLLDGALDALGDDAFSAAADAGSALSIDAAADIAAAELRRIAGKREELV